MPSLTTAQLLDELGQALEAVSPCQPLRESDEFAVFMHERDPDLGWGTQRTVHLAAQAGRRFANSALCDEWETTISIENDVQRDTGSDAPGSEHWSGMLIVVEDAEALLDAAYAWAAGRAGVTFFDPQPGAVQEQAEGALVCIRTITLRYQRT